MQGREIDGSKERLEGEVEQGRDTGRRCTTRVRKIEKWKNKEGGRNGKRGNERTELIEEMGEDVLVRMEEKRRREKNV